MFRSVEGLPDGAIGVEALGTVGAGDSRAELASRISHALETGGKVRLLYLAGPDFAGYDGGAVYDEEVFGSRHFRDFEKIAFVAECGPYRRAVRAIAGLMPADLRIFRTGEIEAAKAWLANSAAV
jgi:hypothetical protein